MRGVVEERRIGTARRARGRPGAGIDDAYAAFFRAEYRSVLRTAFLIVRDRQLAEDVAQDAFVQLYQHWKKVSRYERPEAWVRRVAPTLIVLGRYDPYAAPSVVRRAATTLTRRWVIVNPSGGHNALSQSCMIEIRNEWIRDPTLPPDPGCLPSIPPKPFVIDRQ